MAGRVTRLVADELGITSFTEQQPQASLFGVTNVQIESNGVHYRVYLVRDANNDNVDLEESAKLAAFYNSQFILRAFHTGKLAIPCGIHQVSFQIADDDDNHSIFVVKVPHGAPKESLSLEELCTVAESIAKLQHVSTKFLSEELYKAIWENHSNVADYERSLTTQLVAILETTVTGEQNRYFRNPNEIHHKAEYLFERVKSEKLDGSPPAEEVICHGRLSAAAVNFNGHEVVEITDWENVHFADPAKDLTNLLITSADPEVRRNHYLSVFRHYFYTLIDVRRPKSQMRDFRDMYRRHQKDAVVSGIENLLDVLMNSENEAMKQKTVQRWEAALDDAYAYETGDYVSDDEHCLFSK